MTDFDSLWNYANPAETESQFRSLLPAAEAGDNRSYHAELLTQIARAQGLQRQFEAAHETLDQVEAMGENVSARANVRYLLERGRVFNSSQQPDNARGLFERAWTLAQEAGEDGLAVDAAHMVAILATGTTALEWNNRALELAERSPNPDAQRWVGSLYNNIGSAYFDLEQYDDALSIFKQAASWEKAQGKVEMERIARWSAARVLRARGQLDDALQMQRTLLSEYEDLNEESGYTYEEIAECLYALGKPVEAAPYFAKAHTALSADPWLIAQERERLERLKALSEQPT